MEPSLQLRSISLRVSDLGRSLAFYTRVAGFALARENAGTAWLAVSENAVPLLELIEEKGAAPASHAAAGLFHAALLFPQREALASWMRHAADTRADFDGFSDHGVSEAIYFADPDGNGLEFYADRRPETWPRAGGEIAMFTRPLDLPNLLSTATQASTQLLAGAAWGHLHLRVTDLERSEEFYCAALGLAITQSSYPGARFLAADGYHHHIGLNTWSRPSRPQPPDALGLVGATFAVRSATRLRELRDPDQIAIHVAPAA